MFSIFRLPKIMSTASFSDYLPRSWLFDHPARSKDGTGIEGLGIKILVTGLLAYTMALGIYRCKYSLAIPFETDGTR